MRQRAKVADYGYAVELAKSAVFGRCFERKNVGQDIILQQHFDDLPLQFRYNFYVADRSYVMP